MDAKLKDILEELAERGVKYQISKSGHRLKITGDNIEFNRGNYPITEDRRDKDRYVIDPDRIDCVGDSVRKISVVLVLDQPLLTYTIRGMGEHSPKLSFIGVDKMLDEFSEYIRHIYMEEQYILDPKMYYRG